MSYKICVNILNNEISASTIEIVFFFFVTTILLQFIFVDKYFTLNMYLIKNIIEKLYTFVRGLRVYCVE